MKLKGQRGCARGPGLGIKMIIGNRFCKLAIQLEFIIPDYLSLSGMFNFIID